MLISDHRHVIRQITRNWQARGKKTNEHFADEEHSLQGKEGKTHAVC